MEDGKREDGKREEPCFVPINRDFAGQEGRQDVE